MSGCQFELRLSQIESAERAKIQELRAQLELESQERMQKACCSRRPASPTSAAAPIPCTVLCRCVRAGSRDAAARRRLFRLWDGRGNGRGRGRKGWLLCFQEAQLEELRRTAGEVDEARRLLMDKEREIDEERQVALPPGLPVGARARMCERARVLASDGPCRYTVTAAHAVASEP